MKRQKVDSQRERRLLIAMIVSDHFLGRAARVLDLELIDTPHYRQVAQWCLDYHKEYGKAPGKHIETLYTAWSEDNENTELTQGVSDFLESLSADYDKDTEVNVPYLLDELGEFLAKRRIHRVRQDIEFSLAQGKVRDAEKSLLAYRQVEVQQGHGFNPLRNKAVWKEAFSAQAQPLITLEGDAGKFFNHALTRDAFVAIQAPEKTGKTMWCIELVMRALRQRRKVALFEVGDLSQSQVLLRLGMRWSTAPLWASQVGTPIRLPHTIEIDESEEAGYKVKSRVMRFPEPVTPEGVRKGIKKFNRACGLSKGVDYLQTSVHPIKTLNVAGINAILDQWKLDLDFIPDVIIVDYADILAPEDPKKLDRDQVDDTWIALRRLSQTRHALVIAPTQARARRGGKGDDLNTPLLQTMDDFSDNKKKLAHVTGMFALNQTPEEKEVGGMRLNWIVLREAPFNISRPLYVGTCYSLARALCCAKF